MKKIALLCGLLFLTSACTINTSSQVIRPETLINSSAEKISFPIVDKTSITTIENWVMSGDFPSTAAISCNKNGKICKSVKKILKRRGIAFNEVASASKSNVGNLSLTYNRVIAHKCDDSNFGCSTATNSLQMITNREQFIKPSMSDLQDAAGAVKAINKVSRK